MAQYNYHSALRATVVHPTRDSLEYALLLLDAGGKERAARAEKVIDRLISIQETDPAGRFYGIWGYYLEEPAPTMKPADFNWADFNGSLLLMIELRHGARLPDALRKRVLEAIRHAAYSVKRRNVSMGYTNIAVQGTFVTMAAAQLLGDTALWEYAADRQKRFAKTVDECGSFAEYNSPTYANVTIVNLTRIRMFVKDEAVLALNAKLHERQWLQLAQHWHVPTRQLAGPMSRCYSTDIGRPVWLQKALGGRLPFVSLAEIRAEKTGSGEIGIVDYRCPDKLAARFLEDRPARQHREWFIPSVQGTTWLEKDYCLGSANRGDFWIQRRCLVAYWGGPERPAKFAQLRFMKDDYDFSSALLYTTQERNRVLGLVNFRTPGGDKHISIDMVKDGQFQAASLRLCLEISDPAAKLGLIGKNSATVQCGAVKIWFALRDAVFGKYKAEMRLGTENGNQTIFVDFVREPQAVAVRWSEINPAFAAFTLAMEAGQATSADFAKRMAALPFAAENADSKTSLRWADLELVGGTRVTTSKEQDGVFAESRNGKPMPLVRLSEDRLL